MVWISDFRTGAARPTDAEKRFWSENALRLPDNISQKTRAAAREAVYGAAGAQILIGAGAVVLGILALIGYDWVTLTLIAFLALGGTALLSASAVGGRMVPLLRR